MLYFLFEAVVVFLGFLFVILFISTVIGVPCMPTHLKQAKRMVEMAGLKPGMVAVDLGSGNGRILFLGEKYGAKMVGYELNPILVVWTKLAIKFRKLTGKVEVYRKSIYDADLKNIDVVFAFLMPGPMQKLEPKLFSELKPGARIYSYTFSIPGHEPVQKEQGIFVYQV